ncbi:hypothetical protein B0H14DRAFT_3656305 [Mycena olivaceomarginata]|nr:hypothetical protein B0H14DRAFT_3656305 [Mycena olivaceomarginata]
MPPALLLLLILFTAPPTPEDVDTLVLSDPLPNQTWDKLSVVSHRPIVLPWLPRSSSPREGLHSPLSTAPLLTQTWDKLTSSLAQPLRGFASPPEHRSPANSDPEQTEHLKIFQGLTSCELVGVQDRVQQSTREAAGAIVHGEEDLYAPGGWGGVRRAGGGPAAYHVQAAKQLHQCSAQAMPAQRIGRANGCCGGSATGRRTPQAHTCIVIVYHVVLDGAVGPMERGARGGVPAHTYCCKLMWVTESFGDVERVGGKVQRRPRFSMTIASPGMERPEAQRRGDTNIKIFHTRFEDRYTPGAAFMGRAARGMHPRMIATPRYNIEEQRREAGESAEGPRAEGEPERWRLTGMDPFGQVECALCTDHQAARTPTMWRPRHMKEQNQSKKSRKVKSNLAISFEYLDLKWDYSSEIGIGYASDATRRDCDASHCYIIGLITTFDLDPGRYTANLVGAPTDVPTAIFGLLETSDQVWQPRIDVPGSCDWAGTKFAVAILIDFWTRPLHRVRIHRRHNTSAIYHPPPALQKYQLNPERSTGGASQDIGVIQPNTQVGEDWVEKEDVEMED